MLQHLERARHVEGLVLLGRDVMHVARDDVATEDPSCRDRIGIEFEPEIVWLAEMGGEVADAGAYISRCRDLLNVPPHHVTWWEDRTWHWVADAFGLTDVRLHHTPIDDMLGAWAQMVATDGIARQLGLALDPVVDETPLRQRIDQLAEPVVRTMLAGLTHRADVPEAGHTTVAIMTKPATPRS